MKYFKLFVAGFAFLSLTFIASASGGALTSVFDDVDYEDDWFGEAVYSLYNMGVVEGVDGSYLPGNNLNRAEMAVILSRFYDYLLYPQGEDWVEYKNDFYSVMYPNDPEYTGDIGSVADCSSADNIQYDYGFNITCYDMGEKYNVEALIDNMGDQFEENRRERRSTIEVNGEDATLLSVTTIEDRDWEFNAVFIQVDSQNIIYRISDGALGYPEDFEYFYTSFLLQ